MSGFFQSHPELLAGWLFSPPQLNNCCTYRPYIAAFPLIVLTISPPGDHHDDGEAGDHAAGLLINLLLKEIDEEQNDY